MILATINMESWQVVGGVIVLIMAQGLKFWQEWLKDRRNRALDTASLEALRTISITNAAIRDGQIEQNGKLARVCAVNEAHHLELVRAISGCPHNNVKRAV